MVFLELHGRRLSLFDPLFLLGRAEVAHRGRGRAEVADLRKDVLHPLPQLGHVLWGRVDPLHRRPAQFKEADPGRRLHEQQQDPGGKRAVNPVAGQPADKRLQGHADHAGQKNRQEHRPGYAEGGHHAHCDQDGFAPGGFLVRPNVGRDDRNRLNGERHTRRWCLVSWHDYRSARIMTFIPDYRGGQAAPPWGVPPLARRDPAPCRSLIRASASRACAGRSNGSVRHSAGRRRTIRRG